jgi:hypothetical protein
MKRQQLTQQQRYRKALDLYDKTSFLYVDLYSFVGNINFLYGLEISVPEFEKLLLLR